MEKLVKALTSDEVNNSKNLQIVKRCAPLTVSAGSDTTLYRNAVELELDSKEDESDSSKRISTSSDEGPLISDDSLNRSDERDQAKTADNLIVSEKDQLMFQRFLDCRLDEFRKGSDFHETSRHNRNQGIKREIYRGRNSGITLKRQRTIPRRSRIEQIKSSDRQKWSKRKSMISQVCHKN